MHFLAEDRPFNKVMTPTSVQKNQNQDYFPFELSHVQF